MCSMRWNHVGGAGAVVIDVWPSMWMEKHLNVNTFSCFLRYYNNLHVDEQNKVADKLVSASKSIVYILT